MSLIISFDVTVQCNSSFEKISDEGIECCRSSFSETHHLQPEHLRIESGSWIFSTLAGAVGAGWFTIEDKIYCPQCYTEMFQSSKEKDSSLGKQGYAFPVN